MIDFLLSGDAIMALLTLTFLEVVLGVDNVVFISIAASKLPKGQRKKATNIGLLLAMVQRIILLFLISYLVRLKTPFWEVELSWIEFSLSWQALILVIGGLFLLYKSTSEILEKVETDRESEVEKKVGKSMSSVLIQIVLIDLIFSIDSILTAIGMTNGISPNPNHALVIMIMAVVISMVVMLVFANQIRIYIEKHPSMQLLGLAFLMLIGFLLITEGAHLSGTSVFGKEVGTIPKGYLYFAIAFSLTIELLNIRVRKIRKKSK